MTENFPKLMSDTKIQDQGISKINNALNIPADHYRISMLSYYGQYSV